MRVSGKTGHDCEKCTYVASRECIVIPVGVARRPSTKPVFINFFTMPNWVGHNAFYAFLCRCGYLVVDYPHGYTGPGFLYLTCQNCGVNFVLDSPRYAEIYKREDLEPPKSLFANVLILLKLVWRSARLES